MRVQTRSLKPVEMPDFLDTVERILGTVETFLPPAPIIEETAPPSKTSAECLADLRRATNALAALLLDDHGEIQASAGQMSLENVEDNMIPALMAAHHAGLKVSYAQGIKTPHNLMFFKGRQYHLCIAPVGSSHTILLAFDASLQTEIPLTVSEPVFQAAQEILESLSRVIVTTPVPSQEAPLAPAEANFPEEQVETVLMPQEEELHPETADIPDMSEIFKKEKAALDANEVDSFWDAAVEQNSSNGAGSASALSYDEARRLGLAPKDEAS